MKNYLKYTVFILAGLVLFLTNCSKEVGPDHLPNLPALTRAPIPLFTPDTALDGVIQKPEEFHAAFDINVYFPDDVKTVPTSCDIDVAMNGDYSTIKKLKTGITTFPTKVEVTGDQLAALFGIQTSDIVPGYKFELRATFTLKDGTVLQGFADGVNAVDASSDIKNFPGSNTTLTYNAVCPLDISALLGNKTVSDPFFWGGDYPVKVTQESDNVLRVTGVNQSPNEYILISINPKTFVATVANRVIDPAPTFFPYTNLATSGSGTVDACDSVIGLTLGWTVDQGGFGSGDFSVHN